MCRIRRQWCAASRRRSADERRRHRRWPEEEIADGVQSSPGGGAGDDIRRASLRVERRTAAAGGDAAAERDAGQGLVSEPAQQVEAPVRRGDSDHTGSALSGVHDDRTPGLGHTQSRIVTGSRTLGVERRRSDHVAAISRCSFSDFNIRRLFPRSLSLSAVTSHSIHALQPSPHRLFRRVFPWPIQQPSDWLTVRCGHVEHLNTLTQRSTWPPFSPIIKAIDRFWST